MTLSSSSVVRVIALPERFESLIVSPSRTNLTICVTYEQDGALWFKASEFGNDKDIVLIRANGLPTYIVPDIAYHYNKLVTRGNDFAVDVLGADHFRNRPVIVKTAFLEPAVIPDSVLKQISFKSWRITVNLITAKTKRLSLNSFPQTLQVLCI